MRVKIARWGTVGPDPPTIPEKGGVAISVSAGPASFTAGGPNLSRPTKDQANLYFAPSSPNAYSNSWSGLVSNTWTLFKSRGTVLRSKSSACILLFKSLGDNGNETGAPASGLRENGAAIVFCRPFWK